MPTQQTTYNSRITDEALEKRFRDTFRAQGGAELVDDLYAQGVIVPVVDFTQAATGDVLLQNLQTAWDFSTGHATVFNGTTTLISNAGFWKVHVNLTYVSSAGGAISAQIDITDGLTSKPIWEMNENIGTAQPFGFSTTEFVVFLRSGDSLTANTNGNNATLDINYRQIATVSGDLVNPTGFTSS